MSDPKATSAKRETAQRKTTWAEETCLCVSVQGKCITVCVCDWSPPIHPPTKPLATEVSAVARLRGW